MSNSPATPGKTTTRVDIKAILAGPRRAELLDRATKFIIEVMRWG